MKIFFPRISTWKYRLHTDNHLPWPQCCNLIEQWRTDATTRSLIIFRSLSKCSLVYSVSVNGHYIISPSDTRWYASPMLMPEQYWFILKHWWSTQFMKLNCRFRLSGEQYRFINSSRQRMTHILYSELTSMGSDNSLAPGRRQAIIWIIAKILSIRTISGILSEIHISLFNKMH